MKKVLSSLVIVVLIGSANIFAMDKLTQAEKAKVITAAKAAKGDEHKFQAAIKSIPKAAGITLADALPGIAPKLVQAKGAETGEAVSFIGEEAPPKITSAVTTQKLVQAPKKGVVITEAKIAQLNKEAASLEAEMTQAMSKFMKRAEAIARAAGTQEQAYIFMGAMVKRYDEIMDATEEAWAKVDFSNLPHVEKSPLTEQEKEAAKVLLQDRFRSKGRVMAGTQDSALQWINEQLDEGFKEHDDQYFKQVIDDIGYAK